MMVFVTVGTTQYPFQRLIDTVLICAQKHSDVSFVVQSGSYSSYSHPSSNVFIKNYLSFPEVQKNLKLSQTVVCHAGMGTIIQSHMNGKKPLVLPRQKRYGEHTNDHEILIANFLHKNKKIVYVERLDELCKKIFQNYQTENTKENTPPLERVQLVQKLIEFF